MNGKSTEVNSMSGTTIRVPAGSDAATRPTSPEADAPTVTCAGSAPTRRANGARARSASAFQPSQLVRPWRQSPSACCSASNAVRGGRP